MTLLGKKLWRGARRRVGERGASKESGECGYQDRLRQHRDLIIALAARYRLPAVYANRSFVAAGGLMSYGFDRVDDWRQAATYVDRILRGEKPADLPVQTPVKYETVLNLRTTKALGLTVPDLMIVRAEEVIE
jgi:putative ABC transport system substrate-binding protein